MADSANQHYVPQFYFRGFSNDGRSICVLNRRDGRIVSTASIKGQASKKYFYGDAKMEKALQMVDGAFSGVVKRFREESNFDEFPADDYNLLLQNIMLQKARTASARTRSQAMQDRLVQLQLEIDINADESLDEPTRQECLQSAADATADPKQFQALEMSIALQGADSLFDLLPIILENRTNRPFVFGDAPVVLTNPLYRQVRLRGVLGALTPGLIILYPLSPARQLMLIDENAYRIKRHKPNVLAVRDLADVSELNRLQIHNASSAIYFHDMRFEPYIASLWNAERGRLADNRAVVIQATALNQSGEANGEVLHTFEKQLPLIPQFSFLNYVEIPESEYRFSRRHPF